MQKGLIRALALVAGIAVTAFSGVALGADAEKGKKPVQPDANNCLVMGGKTYRWLANVDPDAPFYAADIKSGKLAEGPIKQDRNINATTDINVIGVYVLDGKCPALPALTKK